MKDVFGIPQSVLIIGGNSEIGHAILSEITGLNRLKQVILITRSGTWNNRERFYALSGSKDVKISVFSFDEFSAASNLQGIEVDLCVVATGFLPRKNSLTSENVEQSLLANLTLPARLTTEIALHMQRQGHGVIVGLSSIAAMRVRPDNWIYGFAKSAFDLFLRNLADELKDSGVSVLTIRSGMVRTRMSAHLNEAPLTVDPEVVARVVRKNLKSDSSVIWVPAPLRLIALILRLLPQFLLKRLRS